MWQVPSRVSWEKRNKQKFGAGLYQCWLIFTFPKNLWSWF
jgi:hypothetical protein